MIKTFMLGHDIMIEKFVDSVANNKPVPVTPEESRETIRTMDMIVKKVQQQSKNENLKTVV